MFGPERDPVLARPRAGRSVVLTKFKMRTGLKKRTFTVRADPSKHPSIMDDPIAKMATGTKRQRTDPDVPKADPKFTEMKD